MYMKLKRLPEVKISLGRPRNIQKVNNESWANTIWICELVPSGYEEGPQASYCNYGNESLRFTKFKRTSSPDEELAAGQGSQSVSVLSTTVLPLFQYHYKLQPSFTCFNNCVKTYLKLMMMIMMTATTETMIMTSRDVMWTRQCLFKEVDTGCRKREGQNLDLHMDTCNMCNSTLHAVSAALLVLKGVRDG
jgi:hypothetical protein